MWNKDAAGWASLALVRAFPIGKGNPGAHPSTKTGSEQQRVQPLVQPLGGGVMGGVKTANDTTSDTPRISLTYAICEGVS